MKQVTIIVLAVGSILGGISSASAEWSVSTGIEYLQWRESTAPSVTEQGGLLTLGLNWTLDKESGWLPAYRGKLYGGIANYNGAFLFSNVPVNDQTTYKGITNEIQAIYRVFYGANPYSVEYVGGVGWDYWIRSISPILATQEEDFGIAYGRLGIDVNSRTEHGLFGGGGIKYPFYTQEDAHFTDLGFDQNPTLHPGKKISGYAQLGYRFDRLNDLILYYEGYRFGQSNTVQLTANSSAPGVTFFAFQPKSIMTIIGLKWQHHF